MTKENKLKVLLPVLFVVAILVWLPNARSAQKKPSQDNSINILSLAEDHTMASLMPAQPGEMKKEKSAYQDWGRNPFVVPDGSLQGPEGKAAPLVLGGIFWNSKKPSALINGTVVGLGAKLEGNTIIDIQPDKVIVDNGTAKLELNMRER